MNKKNKSGSPPARFDDRRAPLVSARARFTLVASPRVVAVVFFRAEWPSACATLLTFSAAMSAARAASASALASASSSRALFSAVAAAFFRKRLARLARRVERLMERARVGADDGLPLAHSEHDVRRRNAVYNLRCT